MCYDNVFRKQGLTHSTKIKITFDEIAQLFNPRLYVKRHNVDFIKDVREFYSGYRSCRIKLLGYYELHVNLLNESTGQYENGTLRASM